LRCRRRAWLEPRRSGERIEPFAQRVDVPVLRLDLSGLRGDQRCLLNETRTQLVESLQRRSRCRGIITGLRECADRSEDD
jgi:hypothetical protein